MIFEVGSRRLPLFSYQAQQFATFCAPKVILLPRSTVQAGYHRLLWHFLSGTLLPYVIGCQAQPSQTHTKKCRQGKTGRGVPIARQTDWAPIRMREQDKELPPEEFRSQSLVA